jgi:hypothetical protein
MATEKHGNSLRFQIKFVMKLVGKLLERMWVLSKAFMTKRVRKPTYDFSLNVFAAYTAG